MSFLVYMTILQIWFASWAIGVPPLATDFPEMDLLFPGTIEEKEWSTFRRQKRFVGNGMDLVHGLLTAITLGSGHQHQAFQVPSAYHARPIYGAFGGRGSTYPLYNRFHPPLYAGYYGLSGFGFH